MITIKLMGGLGNQMFQYAAACSLAKMRQTDLSLDLSWYSQEFSADTTPRQYELSCFVLDQNIQKYRGTAREKVWRRLAKEYIEPHFNYDPIFTQLPKNAVLSGYFQSEKYFSEIRDTLLSDFLWVNEPRGMNINLIKQIAADKNSVSVHVRRGDYVSNKNAAKFHGLTGIEYYKAAVKKISINVKNPNLYVFSDDPEWCRKNLKFTQATTYISHNKDGHEDMRLMKLCKHNILANSSFSWWGAWLGTYPHKKVIAPKQWFTDEKLNTIDLIPKRWHRI